MNNDTQLSLNIFLSGLFFVFLHAKLFGAIDWPWWIVTLPVSIPFGLAFLLAFFAAAVKAIKK
jgi:hypothetical protein